jgi:hypothetical protein
MYKLNDLYVIIINLIKKNRIYNFDMIKYNFDMIKYNKIMNNIRSARSLDSEELLFLQLLPKENLIEIIEINNTYIDLFNQMIINDTNDNK